MQVGDRVTVGGPRNNFALQAGDEPIVLIAGGIGVTPIYAMARALRAEGRPFDLHYLVRSRSHAAFHPDLLALDLGERYHLHDDMAGGRPDMSSLVEQYPTNAHLYVCGPEPMLGAVQTASDTTGRGTVFFERFAAPSAVASAPSDSFHVVVDSSGQTLEVPPDKSILEVLRGAGHDLDYACAEGVCGTCIVDVVEGDIDHRDAILTGDERRAGDCMCICVSRARSDRLVLAL